MASVLRQRYFNVGASQHAWSTGGTHGAYNHAGSGREMGNIKTARVVALRGGKNRRSNRKETQGTAERKEKRKERNSMNLIIGVAGLVLCMLGLVQALAGREDAA